MAGVSDTLVNLDCQCNAFARLGLCVTIIIHIILIYSAIKKSLDHHKQLLSGRKQH